MFLASIHSDELSSTSLMQSPYWASLKGRHGWGVLSFRLAHSSLLVLTRTFLHLFTLAYVPFGPGEQLSLQELSVTLRRFLPRLTFAIRYDLPFASACDDDGLLVQKESVQPDATVLLDLSEGYEAVRKGYHERARRALRKSKDKLVLSLWDGSATAFDEWYALYEETARRDGFSTRGKAYLSDVLSTKTAKVASFLFLARRDGRIVGGTILLMGEQAIYLYGASARMKDCTASHALQDMMIRYAADHHVRTYDFFGVSDGTRRGSHLASLDLFKTSFGGERVVRKPTMDYPYLKMVHYLFTKAEDRRYGKARNA